MLSTIIALGQNLNLRVIDVIAVGGERLQQLDNCPRLDCEEVQGFWLTRTLNPEDVTELLLSNCCELPPTLY